MPQLMSALDAIKQHTTIVADTGDFEGNSHQICHNIVKYYFLQQPLSNLNHKMQLLIPVFYWQLLSCLNIRVLLKNRFRQHQFNLQIQKKLQEKPLNI